MLYLFIHLLSLYSVLCASVVVELSSTAELYSTLLTSPNYSFVYIYSSTCRWCQELDPKYEVLPTVFPNSSINFIKVDGKNAMKLTKDFQVTSFPYLILFKPADTKDKDEGAIKHKLFAGAYHGYRTVQHIAQHLSDMTGNLPQWPGSSVFSNITTSKDFYQHLDPYWQAYLNVNSTNVSKNTSKSLLLTFITPWMDPHYSAQFNGDVTLSVPEKLAKRFPALSIYKLDSSLSELSKLTNLFKIRTFPTLVLLRYDTRGSKTIVLELKPGDPWTWMKEEEILNDFLSNCALEEDNWTSCEDHLENIPSIAAYNSVQELESFIAEYELEIGYDVGEDEWLFNKLHDI